MCNGILKNHPEISKFLRAHLINWIFHVSEVLAKEDKTLPFITINMLDRFLRRQTTAQPAREI
jgi:hypothetical protein